MSVFVRVVEARSFTGAARKLSTTTSAVSKRVAQLEDRLGVRLLERTTRKVALTEAGTTFYDRCVRILAEVEDAELAVTSLSGEPRGTLRVSAPVIFGEMHVAPLVPDFLARHPHVSLDLSLSDRFVSLLDEGFDLAIRIGQLGDSSLVARRLGRVRVLVCASPSYLAKRGTPKVPMDLVSHNCLRYSLVTSNREWSFRTASGHVSVPVTGNFLSNHGGAMGEAALAGLGIARLPDFIVAAAVKRGALKTVLDDCPSSDGGVFAVHPAGRHPPPKITAFVGFLADRLPGRLR